MHKRSKTEEEDRASKDALMDIIRAGAPQRMAQALKRRRLNSWPPMRING